MCSRRPSHRGRKAGGRAAYRSGDSAEARGPQKSSPPLRNPCQYRYQLKCCSFVRKHQSTSSFSPSLSAKFSGTELRDRYARLLRLGITDPVSYNYLEIHCSAVADLGIRIVRLAAKSQFMDVIRCIILAVCPSICHTEACAPDSPFPSSKVPP